MTEETKYYLITYRWVPDWEERARYSEKVTTAHPVDWLLAAALANPTIRFHIVFWSEIPKEVYERAKDKISGYPPTPL